MNSCQDWLSCIVKWRLWVRRRGDLGEGTNILGYSPNSFASPFNLNFFFNLKVVIPLHALAGDVIVFVVTFLGSQNEFLFVYTMCR
jgi:hypothetical protein